MVKISYVEEEITTIEEPKGDVGKNETQPKPEQLKEGRPDPVTTPKVKVGKKPRIIKKEIPRKDPRTSKQPECRPPAKRAPLKTRIQGALRWAKEVLFAIWIKWSALEKGTQLAIFFVFIVVIMALFPLVMFLIKKLCKKIWSEYDEREYDEREYEEGEDDMKVE